MGSVLDFFDENNLWEDTTLILTTDHGFMLGEHDWWAKNRMPLYNEISHIPLFIYHPDYKHNNGGSFVNTKLETGARHNLNGEIGLDIVFPKPFCYIFTSWFFKTPNFI